jgi:hypothetical protein
MESLEDVRGLWGTHDSTRMQLTKQNENRGSGVTVKLVHPLGGLLQGEVH